METCILPSVPCRLPRYACRWHRCRLFPRQAGYEWRGTWRTGHRCQDWRRSSLHHGDLSFPHQGCEWSSRLVAHVLVFRHLPSHKSHIQWNLSNMDTPGPINYLLIREVSSFQEANIAYLYEVGTWSSVLIREVSLIQGCPSRGVPVFSPGDSIGGS